MSIRVIHRRGSTADNDSLTGPAGAVSVDTEKNQMRLHDGVTAGGHVIPNLANLLGIQPTFDPVGDLYSISNVAGCIATAQVNGAVSSAATSVAYDGVVNEAGLVRNTVLRNTTDDDEVVILSVDTGTKTLTTTPTNKAWSDNAVLTNQSGVDGTGQDTVLVDISQDLPAGVSAQSIIGQLWVKEDDGPSVDGTSAFRMAKAGLMGNSANQVDNYPQVAGIWHPTGFMLPLDNNRFSVSIHQAGTTFSARVRVSGYYLNL